MHLPVVGGKGSPRRLAAIMPWVPDIKKRTARRLAALPAARRIVPAAAPVMFNGFDAAMQARAGYSAA